MVGTPHWAGNRTRWHQRSIAGLGSYWIFQHLDWFAERVDGAPEEYRFSYCRDWGTVRLIVVGPRASRSLEPATRALDPPPAAFPQYGP